MSNQIEQNTKKKQRHNRREMDMLNGSLWDKILLFAVPLAATGILQQLFNAADIAVIGRFVGKHAMAAVGSNAPIIGLMVNLFIGISMGANVVIARFIGQNNREGVLRAVHTSLVVAVGGGVLIAVIGELLTVPLLHLMGVPAEVYDMAVLYMRVYLAGMPVIMLYNFESAIYRAKGDTRTPLICLTISGVVNVVLNIFFVVVIGMTVNGVALATVISNLISAVLLLWFLCRSEGLVYVDFRELCLDRSVLVPMLRIGVPAGLQSMVFSLANICIQSAVNSLGADVMAGSSAAFNIEIFSYYIVISFGQACVTFIGQNHGAGKSDRCKRVVKLCLLQDLIAVAFVAALIYAFGRQMLSVFNADPAVLDFGMIRLRYIVGAHLFSCVVEVVSGAMRGYGYSVWPALMTLFGVCGIRVLWVYTIFRSSPSLPRLMIVFPVSLSITALAVLSAYFFLTRTRLRDFFAAA